MNRVDREDVMVVPQPIVIGDVTFTFKRASGHASDAEYWARANPGLYLHGDVRRQAEDARYSEKGPFQDLAVQSIHDGCGGIWLHRNTTHKILSDGDTPPEVTIFLCSCTKCDHSSLDPVAWIKQPDYGRGPQLVAWRTEYRQGRAEAIADHAYKEIVPGVLLAVQHSLQEGQYEAAKIIVDLMVDKSDLDRLQEIAHEFEVA